MASGAYTRFVLRYLVVLLSGLTSIHRAAAQSDLKHLLDNDPEVPALSQYGGVGLLDTRSARFLPDGGLAFTGLAKNPDDRIAVTFQALPWLETTFRWAHNYAIETQSGQGADRSFDLKARLWQETSNLPQLAVGLQDFLGTGIYSGEYLVASKRFGDFDISGGMGWGRLASRPSFKNPLAEASNWFANRTINVQQGGTPTFAYFKGENVGLFGGIEYQTPIRNLKLQFEYSSDAYVREKVVSHTDYSYPVNFGVSYRPYPGVDIGLSYMHGNGIGIKLSIFSDPMQTQPTRFDPFPAFTARDPAAAEAARVRRETEEPKDETWRTHFYDLTHEDGVMPLTAAERAAAAAALNAKTAMDTASSPAERPPAPAPVVDADSAPAAVQTNEEAIAAMKAAIEAQSITVEGPVIEDQRVRVVIQNGHYLRDAEAISRVARVLSATAPSDIEEFEITTTRNSVALATVTLPRSGIDKLARNEGSPVELLQASDLAPAPAEIPELSQPDYPAFDFNVYPSFRESFFDPDNPLYVGLRAGVAENITLARGVSVSSSQFATLYDTSGQIKRVSNSELPHVRSDVAKYLKEAKNGFETLGASYYFKLSPTVYVRALAGYLEEMYGGVGGEILYRPFDKRWAIGANLWAVRQREYDELFGLRSYGAITGHASLYYDTPWYGVQFKMHVGQYLAKDDGVTFELSRLFDTGWEIGAWATFTNVSAQKFGEGSFDKGIMIRIPLEWALPIGSPSVFDLRLRPIQRDGGQRLDNANTLYDITQPSSGGQLTRQWDSVFKP